MLRFFIILEAFSQHKIDTKKYFPGLYCHNFKVHLTFFPQIFALIYQILSQQTFTHFLKFMSKNPQHDRVKPRGGGGQGPFTQCVKKTSDLVADGFPYKREINHDRWVRMRWPSSIYSSHQVKSTMK